MALGKGGMKWEAPHYMRPSRDLQHGGHQPEREEVRGTPKWQKNQRGGLAAGWGVSGSGSSKGEQWFGAL